MAKIAPRDRVLDRRVPTDYEHVQKYPARALRAIARTVEKVERRFSVLKRWVGVYDQGTEGACVGFGQSYLMSILNRRLYDALWLYREAQVIDEYPETPPEGGTSLRAGFDVLRDKGHRRLWNGQSKPPAIDEGIVGVNRWLTTVDEVRTAVAAGYPVVLGIPWHDTFYEPTRFVEKGRKEFWIGRDAWGPLAGYHCICLIGASDRRQAGLLRNSWGEDYPEVWVPYESLGKLILAENFGEAAIVTDR